jgi:hypothetical protein
MSGLHLPDDVVGVLHATAITALGRSVILRSGNVVSMFPKIVLDVIFTEYRGSRE